ncbi:MAG TPA: T9SS type A sorting domain-containing protein, partial [Sphingobacteriaceae bacterium]
NQASSPSTGLYTVFVTGDVPARNSYVNDFNAESFDFIGNSFSIATPANFENGAIHSEHPYEDGSGPNNESNYSYQLQVPIIISAANHFIQFDEIVLVEPGEDGSEFGDADFFDYVIVEGSKDNGSTWTPFEDGYDSRANPAWLTRYNTNIVSNSSTATGIPSLFRERQIDMLGSTAFKAGDQIKVRFRLFADEAAHGWGWAIDNLSIQGSVTETEYQPVESVELFPNPANDVLRVRLPAFSTNLEIFDAAGRKVFSSVATESETDVDVHEWPGGIYFLRCVSHQTVVTRKFSKAQD